MPQLPIAHSFVTPGAIVAALLGFLVGGVSLAFNPFFASSVLGVALCLIALRGAAKIGNEVVQGLLRIFAVIGVLGAAGGIVVLLFPGLGVRG